MTIDGKDFGTTQWNVGTSFQNLVGFEKPLSEHTWIKVLGRLSQGTPPDLGLLSFVDAIAAYMAGDDNACLLALAVSIEILASKRAKVKENKNLKWGVQEAARKSDLITSVSQRRVLEDLSEDRDHVAHGRVPRKMGVTEARAINDYLDAVFAMVQTYISFIASNEHEIALANTHIARRGSNHATR